MSNQLEKIFNYYDNKIRTVIVDNEIYFVAKDVCEVLEIRNHKDAINRLDSDEKYGVAITDSMNRQQVATGINEAGLYTLILTSRKPEAKQFKRWITHTVIPSIRKNGAYMTENTLEQAINNPDFTIGLLTKLKEEQERAKQLEFENKLKEMTIQKQTPKVESFDRYINSDGSYCIRDVGKILGYGQKEFFELLRENEILFKHRNVPYQKYIDSGYFDVKTGSGVHSEKTFLQSRITTKGLDWLSKKFNKAV